MLSFMMAHQQVLSVPSDLLVCLMTFMRLKIIMKVPWCQSLTVIIK